MVGEEETAKNKSGRKATFKGHEFEQDSITNCVFKEVNEIGLIK